MKNFTTLIALWLFTSIGLATAESPVKIIPLAPPLNQAEAELSGMTWCGNKLMLMPQYPKRLSDDGNSYFYFLEKSQILRYLSGQLTNALNAMPIQVHENDIREAASIFDGFEAIACDGNTLWLSIEAVTEKGEYRSFLTPASITFGDQSSIEIHHEKLVHLPSLSKMNNIGDEAIILSGDRVIAIHEVNDRRAVNDAKARVYDGMLHEIPFPNLPYRITDTSNLDQNSRFWAINYKYSGDKFSREADDKLADQYGRGASHKKYYNVERLIEFKLTTRGVELVKRAPIQLLMDNVEGRNWEGLARLDDLGFLLVTDKHPKTLLGFVATDKPELRMNN